MKRTHTCPKCGHGHILYIAQIADRVGDSGHHSKPMSLAHFESAVRVLGLTATQSGNAGELEAGVCRGCGFVEFYVKDPAQIPIDGVYVREIS